MSNKTSRCLRLGHPVAHVAFPVVRKTGGTPLQPLPCRIPIPRCRENALFRIAQQLHLLTFPTTGRRSVSSIPDLLTAVATVLRALAWPAVAGWFLWLFRAPIKDLLPRLRRGGPAEFYPPPAQTTAAETPTTTLAALAKVQVTPAMTLLEEQIRAMDEFRGPEPTAREQLLFRVLARVTTLNHYREVEAAIWASQMALLEYLNSRRGQGDTPQNLKTAFYDPAAARFPQWFINYPFESYLNFLVFKQLVAIDAQTVRITPLGIDYLAWRVSTAQPPKLAA